jgi:CHAP domain
MRWCRLWLRPRGDLALNCRGRQNHAPILRGGPTLLLCRPSPEIAKKSSMPHFRKLGGRDQAGYDESRALQVLPIAQQTTFYLVAGADLDVSVDDENLVSLTVGSSDEKAAHSSTELTAWEKGNVIRKIVVNAKNNEGETTLRAKLNSNDFAQPITLRIIHDQNWRRVGKAAGECTPELRQELQLLPVRDAVLRVAEDQLHSSVCSRSNGFGVYNIDKTYDWCGAFAFWCWEQAATIKGLNNPFGSKSSVLWSPQRAIDWAIDPSSAGQLLRYQGGNPMTGKGTQEYREIGWNGYQLERGDIVLLRLGNAGGWKHVCMVDKVNGSALQTIDGNQGANQSIKKVSRSLDEKLPDGSYKLVFVHALI